MVGNGQFDAAEGEIIAPADVEGMRFDALALTITGDLEVGNDSGTCPFGDVHCITHVIAMAVRKQDVIGSDFISLDRRQWVAG